MQWTIGCTTRPYNGLSYTDAFGRIARAGYTDVAVFANEGQVPVRSDSTATEVAAVKKAAASGSFDAVIALVSGEGEPPPVRDRGDDGIPGCFIVFFFLMFFVVLPMLRQRRH